MRFGALLTKAIEIQNFQFSLWDSSLLADSLLEPSLTFNSLYEIPTGKSQDYLLQQTFQFSLWDSYTVDGKMSAPQKTFQFFLWDSIFLKNSFRLFIVTFNSLYEILLQSYSNLYRILTFNSLYEIHNFNYVFLVEGIVFQFSLWDSELWRCRKHGERVFLSILFMRFHWKMASVLINVCELSILFMRFRPCF